MSGVAEVYEVANRLPTFTDDIARMLQMLGIRGRQGDPFNCPMAHLFRLFAHPMDSVIVDSDSLIRVGGYVIETPVAVDAFIAMFDSGCYPELVDRPAIGGAS